jgi:hypothetical protein
MCFSATVLDSYVGVQYTVYTHSTGLPVHLWRVFNVRNAMLLGGPNGVGWKEVKEASLLFRPTFRFIRPTRMDLQLSNILASCVAISVQF